MPTPFNPPPERAPWVRQAPAPGSLDLLARLRQDRPDLWGALLKNLRRRKQQLTTTTVNPYSAPLPGFEDVTSVVRY